MLRGSPLTSRRMSNRYVRSQGGGWNSILRAENVKNLGAAVAAEGAAAEDPGLSRADDASDGGACSVRSGATTQLGERSEAGTVGGDSAEEDDAVAKSKLVVWLQDPVYQTFLPPEKLKAWSESKAIMGDHVGNIGFLFGIWGKLPANELERERVLVQLKKQPAQIVCVAEAQKRVVRTLSSPPVVGAANAVADALAARPEYE